MVGPPGSGKSMLAQRLPSILPPLGPRELLEVSMIASIAGELAGGKLTDRRPFRAPHHSASMAAMVGGGARARPGEVSLAHHGVLFLDEFPEFSPQVLDSLRQPLETGDCMIARVNHRVSYPARIQLVAAMNPCRCGYIDDAERACTRVPKCGVEYQSKISGPLYDRVDIFIDVPALKRELAEIAPTILPYARPAWRVLNAAFEDSKRVLFEGAQGVLLDVDHGTYPFVTSSNVVAGQAAAGSGVGPRAISYVLGLVKAYTTRVGGGPFPTELDDEVGRKLGEVGHEFGTNTGRPRRCGWFDAVLVHQSIALSGADGIALTKLDVLDGFDEIKICTGYKLDGKTIDYLPASVKDQAACEPIYETLDGWKKTAFYGADQVDVRVEDGAILLPVGKSMSGVTTTRDDLPSTNYELTYEAMRTEGEDFWQELEEDGLCWSGVLHASGSWPAELGSVRVSSTTGFTDDELLGTGGDVDASPISHAVIEAVMTNFHKWDAWKRRSAGSSPAPGGLLKSERAQDYSYTLSDGSENLLGMAVSLPPSAA